jgi:hypothetical protein
MHVRSKESEEKERERAESIILYIYFSQYTKTALIYSLTHTRAECLASIDKEFF